MNTEKKSTYKVYLLIGIIFFAIGAYIAGTQGGGLVNGTINTITGSLGIFLILKYFYSGKKID